MTEHTQVTEDVNEEPTEVPPEDNGTVLLSTKRCTTPMLAGEMWYMSSPISKITKEQWTRQMPASSGMKVKRSIQEMSD
uniref:Uncharacterized protein n=1 Tax=Panthera leo TaxID=9689 RepID=A0A8C8XQD1_PANLE